MSNYTRLNPDGISYRIPLINGIDCRIDGTSQIPCVFGKISNRLGAYERIGIEPEEIERILKQHKYI